MENFVVKKWGGENASELVRSPQNVVNDFLNWVKQAVVVSAIRSSDFNTTDALISIWNSLNKWEDKSIIISKVQILKQFHIDMVNEKLWINWNEVLNYIEIAFSEFIENINQYLNSHNKTKPTRKNDYSIETQNWLFSIIWFWEELSANIQSQVINSLKIDWLNAETVDLSWVVPENNDELNENELFTLLSKEISDRVKKILDDWKVPIIPWYIPWFKNGIENAIWRWYSDVTAEIVSLWMSRAYNVTLEIQKAVRWMLSADPRIVKNTKLIERIDYFTAKEITWARWAKAKLLHDKVLNEELLKAWINIRLFDPFSWNPWTLISRSKNENSSWVEFVWWKDVKLFTISSWNMESKWILSDIFSIVKEYVAVDIVSSSETEISFTVDNLSQEMLEEISSRVKKDLKIEDNLYGNFVKYEDFSLVFCVWQNMLNDNSIIAKITTSLVNAWINIWTISQWKEKRAIAIWVEKSELKRAIQILHRDLIEN
jgi:bifunctional aspartokinase / homoserine dehydrogenase 1